MKTSDIFCIIAYEVIILNNYEAYRYARDMSWKFLIACNIGRLPVDVGVICDSRGYKLYSYADGMRIIKAFGREEQCKRSDGFTILYEGTYYIFYSDNCMTERQRFTVAHEIGHIVLGHLSEGGYTTRNREPKPGDHPIETQANQFAARLLAPACVLNALNAATTKEISELCGISMQAAEFRTFRMQTLQKRNMFLSHPLERQVYQQFQPYIRKKLKGF